MQPDQTNVLPCIICMGTLKLRKWLLQLGSSKRKRLITINIIIFFFLVFFLQRMASHSVEQGQTNGSMASQQLNTAIASIRGRKVKIQVIMKPKLCL